MGKYGLDAYLRQVERSRRKLIGAKIRAQEGEKTVARSKMEELFASKAYNWANHEKQRQMRAAAASASLLDFKRPRYGRSDL